MLRTAYNIIINVACKLKVRVFFSWGGGGVSR